jgi:hypothetical protein
MDDFDYIKERAQRVEPAFCIMILEGCMEDLEEISVKLNFYAGTDLEEQYLTEAKTLRKEKRIWELICELQAQELEAMQEADRIDEIIESALAENF